MKQIHEETIYKSMRSTTYYQWKCNDHFLEIFSSAFLIFFRRRNEKYGSQLDEFSVVSDEATDNKTSLGGRVHSGVLVVGRSAGGMWLCIGSEDCIEE